MYNNIYFTSTQIRTHPSKITNNNTTDLIVVVNRAQVKQFQF